MKSLNIRQLVDSRISIPIFPFAQIKREVKAEVRMTIQKHLGDRIHKEIITKIRLPTKRSITKIINEN